jgi:hypothetical protein
MPSEIWHPAGLVGTMVSENHAGSIFRIKY